jgi:integrase
LQARVKLGEDPAGEKAEEQARAGETFLAVAKLWLTKKRTKDNVRASTIKNLERYILRHAKSLHQFKLAGLAHSRAAAACIDALGESGGKSAANRMQAALSQYFTFAVLEGYMERNPLAGSDTFAEIPRDRVLNDEELAAIWDHAGDDHFGRIVRLLMLTGQRREEIGGLLRSELSNTGGFDVIDLPPSRTKNHRRHLIPLSRPAAAILEACRPHLGRDGRPRDAVFGVGERGFSGWSRCKAELDGRISKARGAPLAGWVLHDLRRSLDTQLNDRFGVMPHVVEAILNHVSTAASARRGIAGTYNYAQYLNEKTAALGLWGDHIMSLTGGDVIPLQAVGHV